MHLNKLYQAIKHVLPAYLTRHVLMGAKWLWRLHQEANLHTLSERECVH